MKVYQPNEIKNLSLIGAAGSGKTTLAEAMMFEAGVISRRGDIESQNTGPWGFPGKNIGVGCHFLLQRIFLTQGLNPSLLHWQVGSLLLSHRRSQIFH